MIKIEAVTLEDAYTDAANTLGCSVAELNILVIQYPKSGVLGFFKKNAIITATVISSAVEEKVTPVQEELKDKTEPKKQEEPKKQKKEETKQEVKQEIKQEQPETKATYRMHHDTIMPVSFVSDQDDEDDDLKSGLEYTADYDDAYDEDYEQESRETRDLSRVVVEIEEQINALFAMTCFSIDKIYVSVYDEQTLLVEFTGEDAALLIGKEGYRYKALSYMIFNWLNSKYDVQLRLEIAEFLKNQEESIGRYLVNVYENIERDGRAQTKILDGVLVQIALKELRERYPEKYVVIRSTKDGLKYIIVNDYHNN